MGMPGAMQVEFVAHFFAHIWLVALARMKVVLSLTTHLTRNFCLLSPCDGLVIDGHGAKDEILVLPLEAILICMPIVHGTLVELPWSSKKEVAHRHGSDVTLNRILIRANIERNLDLLMNLDAPVVA